MELFESREFAFVLVNIQEYLDECEIGKRMAEEGKCARRPPAEVVSAIKGHLAAAKSLCTDVGFVHAKDTIGLILAHWHDDDIPADYSGLFAQLLGVRDALLTDHHKWKFIAVHPSSGHLVDNKSLFGDAVNRAFPDSNADITEAGNCLAAGCGTASVFHLMRAAEFALRALAKDRNVSFCDKPIDEKEWGQLLCALESELTKLRGEDTKNWQEPIFKQSQLRFYHEVVQELRTFNEAWRRHVSHADVQAFYDVEHASSIMKHVKNLMLKLSGKITQSQITPHYWNFA